jgi:hypothetical protein
VPLAVTVTDDDELLMGCCHQIPSPPLPGVAVRVAASQYVPLPLTAGAAGCGTTALTTDAGGLAQLPLVVTAVYVPPVFTYRYEYVLPSSSHRIPLPPVPGVAVTLDD